ncbi:MAG: DNA polymerase III subunit gamma/tau [Opitutaceae bacterium]
MAQPAEAPAGRPWPPGLAETPAAGVIDRAIARGRLAHSLLLHGDGLETLSAAAETLASRLLGSKGSHPDCFALRPAGKSRQISAEATRGLISRVQVSATLGTRKVAIVFEADRMNLSAANIFLKTLEEPPPDTTLLLVSVHPYALIPTIRSRCLHFRFPTDPALETPGHSAGWPEWLETYGAWLAGLGAAAGSRTAAADAIFGTYGLVARFDLILERATAEAWERQKASLPAELEDDERAAAQTGLANGLRSRFFADVEAATRNHARARLPEAGGAVRRPFTAAISEMERGAGLLRLNLNESAVLENFLLASLRLWADPRLRAEA